MLKSLKLDYGKNKYKSLIKKKHLLIVTEILIGLALTTRSSTLAILIPSVGVVISSSAALLTSVPILITSEYI